VESLNKRLAPTEERKSLDIDLLKCPIQIKSKSKKEKE
jgi:hypothetical protein